MKLLLEKDRPYAYEMIRGRLEMADLIVLLASPRNRHVCDRLDFLQTIVCVKIVVATLVLPRIGLFLDS